MRKKLEYPPGVTVSVQWLFLAVSWVALQCVVREDRGKMIHFFKNIFSCFYDWIYLIAFKCIIHCQVLATT